VVVEASVVDVVGSVVVVVDELVVVGSVVDVVDVLVVLVVVGRVVGVVVVGRVVAVVPGCRGWWGAEPPPRVVDVGPAGSDALANHRSNQLVAGWLGAASSDVVVTSPSAPVVVVTSPSSIVTSVLGPNGTGTAARVDGRAPSPAPSAIVTPPPWYGATVSSVVPVFTLFSQPTPRASTMKPAPMILSPVAGWGWRRSWARARARRGTFSAFLGGIDGRSSCSTRGSPSYMP
jgi:hypothetical protein